MNRLQRMQRLLTWLSYMPPLDRVARSLVLDYLSSIHPNESIIWHLNKNDSLICLAHYGEQESLVGRTFPGTEWRNWSKGLSSALQATSNKPITWNKGNTQVTSNLYAQNMLIGFLVLRFEASSEITASLNSDIEELSWPLSLYLALQYPKFLGLSHEIPTSNNPLSAGTANGTIELTPRQISVLLGIVAKKTNHKIADELGFSVSTIRHETMKIFEAFGVSDREAAAIEAHKSGLLA